MSIFSFLDPNKRNKDPCDLQNVTWAWKEKDIKKWKPYMIQEKKIPDVYYIDL
jgi:hypothetical protein